MFSGASASIWNHLARTPMRFIASPLCYPRAITVRWCVKWSPILPKSIPASKLREHLEDRLATIACHSVIRANRMLEMDEMRALLSDLDQIDFATQCPHGRPVLIEISRDELERMFKRVV